MGKKHVANSKAGYNDLTVRMVLPEKKYNNRVNLEFVLCESNL